MTIKPFILLSTLLIIITLFISTTSTQLPSAHDGSPTTFSNNTNNLNNISIQLSSHPSQSTPTDLTITSKPLSDVGELIISAVPFSTLDPSLTFYGSFTPKKLDSFGEFTRLQIQFPVGDGYPTYETSILWLFAGGKIFSKTIFEFQNNMASERLIWNGPPPTSIETLNIFCETTVTSLPVHSQFPVRLEGKFSLIQSLGGRGDHNRVQNGLKIQKNVQNVQNVQNGRNFSQNVHNDQNLSQSTQNTLDTERSSILALATPYDSNVVGGSRVDTTFYTYLTDYLSSQTNFQQFCRLSQNCDYADYFSLSLFNVVLFDIIGAQSTVVTGLHYPTTPAIHHTTQDMNEKNQHNYQKNQQNQENHKNHKNHKNLENLQNQKMNEKSQDHPENTSFFVPQQLSGPLYADRPIAISFITGYTLKVPPREEMHCHINGISATALLYQKPLPKNDKGQLVDYPVYVFDKSEFKLKQYGSFHFNCLGPRLQIEQPFQRVMVRVSYFHDTEPFEGQEGNYISFSGYKQPHIYVDIFSPVALHIEPNVDSSTNEGIFATALQEWKEKEKEQEKERFWSRDDLIEKTNGKVILNDGLMEKENFIQGSIEKKIEQKVFVTQSFFRSDDQPIVLRSDHDHPIVSRSGEQPIITQSNDQPIITQSNEPIVFRSDEGINPLLFPQATDSTVITRTPIITQVTDSASDITSQQTIHSTFTTQSIHTTLPTQDVHTFSTQQSIDSTDGNNITTTDDSNNNITTTDGSNNNITTTDGSNNNIKTTDENPTLFDGVWLSFSSTLDLHENPDNQNDRLLVCIDRQRHHAPIAMTVLGEENQQKFQNLSPQFQNSSQNSSQNTPQNTPQNQQSNDLDHTAIDSSSPPPQPLNHSHQLGELDPRFDLPFPYLSVNMSHTEYSATFQTLRRSFYQLRLNPLNESNSRDQGDWSDNIPRNCYFGFPFSGPNLAANDADYPAKKYFRNGQNSKNLQNLQNENEDQNSKNVQNNIQSTDLPNEVKSFPITSQSTQRNFQLLSNDNISIKEEDDFIIGGFYNITVSGFVVLPRTQENIIDHLPSYTLSLQYEHLYTSQLRLAYTNSLALRTITTPREPFAQRIQVMSHYDINFSKNNHKLSSFSYIAPFSVSLLNVTSDIYVFDIYVAGGHALSGTFDCFLADATPLSEQVSIRDEDSSTFSTFSSFSPLFSQFSSLLPLSSGPISSSVPLTGTLTHVNPDEDQDIVSGFSYTHNIIRFQKGQEKGTKIEKNHSNNEKNRPNNKNNNQNVQNSDTSLYNTTAEDDFVDDLTEDYPLLMKKGGMYTLTCPTGVVSSFDYRLFQSLSKITILNAISIDKETSSQTLQGTSVTDVGSSLQDDKGPVTSIKIDPKDFNVFHEDFLCNSRASSAPLVVKNAINAPLVPSIHDEILSKQFIIRMIIGTCCAIGVVLIALFLWYKIIKPIRERKSNFFTRMICFRCCFNKKRVSFRNEYGEFSADDDDDEALMSDVDGEYHRNHRGNNKNKDNDNVNIQTSSSNLGSARALSSPSSTNQQIDDLYAHDQYYNLSNVAYQDETSLYRQYIAAETDRPFTQMVIGQQSKNYPLGGIIDFQKNNENNGNNQQQQQQQQQQQHRR